MDEQTTGCVSAIIGIIVAFVIMAVIGGSFRTEVTYVPQGGDSLAMQTSFKEHIAAKHFLGGLIKGKQPDLQAAVDKHLGPGKTLAKLTITTRHSVKDALLMAVTLLIYCPHSVTVEGSVNQAVVE